MSERSAKTPDGYDMCPECGHNTSACLAGICTVIIPAKMIAGDLMPYCNCDCYRALHGISLMDKAFGATGMPREDG